MKFIPMARFLHILAITLCVTTVKAQDFTTQGNGTTYTLESLSQIAESGVTKDGPVYIMPSNVTIAQGDRFELDEGATLKLGDGVLLRIEGTADLSVEERALITRNAEADKPKGIGFYVDDPGSTTVKNVDFEYCGLRDGIAEISIDNCTFRYSTNALSSSGALSLSEDGGNCTVTNCTFEENEVPAIGGEANVAYGLYVDNCIFHDNNTENSDQPQVNVTVSGDNDIVIRNSTFTGNKRTMVGAIAVDNMQNLAGSSNVIIENCEIRYHRYGITTNGAMNVTIKGNYIISNKYETNAMDGGSGIRINDSGYQQTAVITGNHIEDNLWGITIIGGKNVNCGKTFDQSAADYNPGENVFLNNGNGDEWTPFDLYNNGTSTVYAQGNEWSVEEQTAVEIEKVIYHQADDAALGRVIYMPGDGGIEGIPAEQAAAYFDRGNKRIVTDAADGSRVEVFSINGMLAGTYFVANGSAKLYGLENGIFIARIIDSKKIIVLKCVL